MEEREERFIHVSSLIFGFVKKAARKNIESHVECYQTFLFTLSKILSSASRFSRVHEAFYDFESFP